MVFRRCMGLALLLALLLSLAGCAAAEISEPKPSVQPWTPTPEPRITAEPAKLLRGVETDRKVISLIFEGFTDSATMEAISDVLKSRSVSSVFFLSGITANENPQVLKKLTADGFAIGSYGMSGGKHLEELSPYENMRRFEMAQKEIEAACGKRPALIRCNGTEYTENVLRAVSAAGLDAAVEPTAYLNHKSFRSQEDAETYAMNVLRGSILTFKLGQELDENEYDDTGPKLDERPAIDPKPGIRWEWDVGEEKYALLPNMVGWLIDALKSQGYRFTDPVKLQSEEQVLLRKERDLDDEERFLLNAENYAFSVTEEPLRAGEIRQAKTGSFNGAVFVGDAVLEGVHSYVEWLREADPKYLDNASFLTEDQLTVEKLLDGETEIGDLGSRLSEMKAKSVWLCLGFSNASAYKREAYLAKYRLLIKQIQDKNPRIRIIVMSVFPKLEGYTGVSNRNRFELNLKLCGMCMEYGFGFVDAAFAVRDETGQLRPEYCLDPTSRGCHLNDAGCAAVVDFIRENEPA